jgi:nucleoside-diphosphate-sugar epimerase
MTMTRAETIAAPRTASAASEIVEAMRAAAPPGSRHLDEQTISTLSHLTGCLIDVRRPLWEGRRFSDARLRSLVMPSPAAFPPRTVLVTGGTGCIGSMVLRELIKQPGTTVVSVSRGLTPPATYVPGVKYIKADIRSAAEVHQTLATVRPDVVYHLAAVRDPALAEIEVERTIATNIVGTANLIAAAESVGVHTFVYASTGKAVRFFTSGVYAASKKFGERLVANSALPIRSYVRYTHVADNSLIMRKLAAWCSGSLVRLHAPDIAFYVQSARESAQLLIAAEQRSGFYSIRDLDWPVSLLDLALAVMWKSGRPSPIYFCGYEPGYEATTYPGLYDPRVSGDTGPLVNALEAHAAVPVLGGQLNHVPVAVGDTDICEAAVAAFRAYDDQPGSPTGLRSQLADLTWRLLDAMLARTAPAQLKRLTEIATRYPPDNREHEMTTSAIVGAATSPAAELAPFIAVAQ